MNRAVSRNEFKKDVIDSIKLSLVQFKVEWSGTCQIISPLYEELAMSYNGQVDFFTVDVDDEKGLDVDYGVIELPTILFFKNGKVVDHVKGLVPKNVVINKIENALLPELN